MDRRRVRDRHTWANERGQYLTGFIVIALMIVAIVVSGIVG